MQIRLHLFAAWPGQIPDNQTQDREYQHTQYPQQLGDSIRWTLRNFDNGKNVGDQNQNSDDAAQFISPFL